MGLLINGHWSSAWYDTSKSEGQFVRDTARYRNWITADGSAGSSGKSGFLQKVAVTIFICPMPAHGHTAR